jgi:hypothetical protein
MRPRHYWEEIPDLFHPRPRRPTWTMIPQEERARVISLLAKLVRTTIERRRAAGAGRRRAHE